MKSLVVLLSISLSMLLLVACGDDSKKESKSNQSKSKGKSVEALFQLIKPDSSGIDFSNSFTQARKNEFYDFQYQFNGGGVGIADFNQDGLNDVFFCGNEVDNKLYFNQGELKFKDVSESAGVALPGSWCNGVAVIDINDDGYPDIYISKGGNVDADSKRNSLMVNNGDGTFTDQAEQYGIADSGWSTQSIFLDFDNDNDLDLFVLNHPNLWYGDKKMSQNNYRNAKLGADHFYINEGGKFKDATDAVGLKEEILGGYGLGVAVGDLDQNGYPDIYVSNDYDSPDFMYMNQGDGTFKEEVKARTTHIALYSMGNDIADFNNDGLLDFIALDMSAEDHVRLKTQMGAMAPEKFYELVRFGLPHQYMYNTLQLNNGNGTFSDIGQLAGVHSTDWSWSPLFADFDNDGYKDLLVTNGYLLDDRDNDFNRLVRTNYGNESDLPDNLKTELFNNTPKTPLANYLYKNNGDFTFSKKTYEWGLSQKGFTQGAAFGDLDNDGDLDLIMNNMEEKAWLYENQANNLENKFLNVRLEEKEGVRFGALVKVKAGDQEQTQQIQPTRGYLSTCESNLHFGLADYEGTVEINVYWKDGTRSTLSSDMNTTVSVSKAGASAYKKPNNNAKYFADVEGNLGIGFTHNENKFDDFKKEILLPHRNSQHGPGMASGDLNGDGLTDLYIGGAHQQDGAVYFQTKSGKFSLQSIPAIKLDRKHEDLGALIYDYDGDGDQDLYVVSGGNEFPVGDPLYADRLYENKGRGVLAKTKGVLPESFESGKSIEAGDYDKDGDLDLFVGGRLLPGTYPFPPTSSLLKFEDGKYIDVTKVVIPEVAKAGLVTNSVWVDYDNDEDLDLLVVGEWMPIMLFNNDGGKFTWLKDNDLSKQVGWWSGLLAEDLDGDGDIDFMVGNLGLNYKYKATSDAPFQIWCHDFDENGSLDIVLGYYDHGACYPVRGRQCSSQQMPFIKDKFPTYNEFAGATIKDVYGESLNNALNYQVNNFASIYIENLGGGQFKIKQLPQECQFSMVTDFASIDLDNDGQKEIVMSGNLYTAEVETPRADASIGMVIKLKDNNWESWTYPISGLYVPGDSKQMDLIELGDQSKKLIITKNNTQPQVVSIVK